MDLADFLKRELSASGPWNCSTFPADWCIARGHPDFAAAWRDVTDEIVARGVTDAAGGLVPLWNLGIGDALAVVDEESEEHQVGLTLLAPGDIAVVAALGLEAGAIWTGQRWAFRKARGLGFIAAEAFVVRKVWRP